MLDHRLTFKSSMKAGKVVAAPTGVILNSGGPKSPRRLLLIIVHSSILLYTAPVWTNVLTLKALRRKLSAVNRLRTVRVANAF